MGSREEKAQTLMSSVGVTTRSSQAKACATERGVTLIEALIVVALISVVAAVSYPSVSAGLDALRMRQTSDQVVKFLSAALDRADRKQQVVQLVIAPGTDEVPASLLARSEDLSFNRSMVLPPPFRMNGPQETRMYLLYPGGSVPRIAIEITHPAGRRRTIGTDPLTGTAQAQ